jgi:acetyl-CoA synthetase
MAPKMAIETLLDETRVYKASDTFKQNANYKNPEIYKAAEKDRIKFWEERARELTWQKPWNKVLEWNRPYAKWFMGGKLNASENCLDVHLKTHRKNKIALIWEGEMGEVKKITYEQLHEQVSKFASVLKNHFQVKKGDRVTIYLPMIIESVVATLACARIGAIHSVIFGGFSANSVKDRVLDSESKIIITADGSYRRGQVVPLKEIVDQALSGNDTPVKNVIVVKHLPENENKKSNAKYTAGRDHDYAGLMQSAFADCAPEPMDSEDVLFILYTSGTTGKPKGIVHTTGGYLTHAKYSTHAVFDIKDSDIYFCTADVGWITGHTYVIYGPLACGATVLMYEGSPDYPDKDRFWDLIEKHKATILYTAPTAIRQFMKWGHGYATKHNLSSLRLLGSVGEPINPEAWVWYHKYIGGEKCPVVDTWWQTETGGIMISNLPAMNDMKPGHTGLPLPGVEIKILENDGKEIKQGGGLLSITQPWPSMLRGIWGDNKRFEEVYWSKFETYFAGDGATIDEDGYVMVLGRVDDVLNVAGHRIGTMEVESVLVEFKGVAEAAVVGMPDEIKGSAIVAFVTMKESAIDNANLEKELIKFVGEKIGAIAKPKKIIFTPELPKTRSGKIMRRLLKDIAEGKPIGDTTTLANPAIVEKLAESFS